LASTPFKDFGIFIESLSFQGSLYAFWEQREDKVLKEVFFSEANLRYLFKNLELMVGRFSVDTPYANSDDVRIVPNYFQGVKLNYFNLTLFYLSKMAGWESGEKIGEFKSLGKVLGREVGGVYIANLEGENLSSWFYHLKREGSLFYMQDSFNVLDFKIALECSYYLPKRGENALAMGILFQKKAGEIEYLLGYNKVFKGEMIGAFGASPYFTSLEELSLDLASEKAESIMVGVEREIKNLLLGTRGGRFEGKEFSKGEIDFYLWGKVRKHLNLEGVFSTIKDLRESKTQNLFRIILKAGF